MGEDEAVGDESVDDRSGVGEVLFEGGDLVKPSSRSNEEKFVCCATDIGVAEVTSGVHYYSCGDVG